MGCGWSFGAACRTSRRRRPRVLTPGEGAVEQTSVSPDGRFLFYATNAGDIERRHVWKVPTAGGAGRAADAGRDDRDVLRPRWRQARVAVLGGDAKRPFGVGLVPASGGAAEIHLPVAGRVSDRRARSMPQLVRDEGADGTRDSQSAVPAEGPEAGREAAGDRVRARRSGAADAARLPLHALLPRRLRRQSVAGEPRLRRDVGQLPQRHRLRQVVPHGAEHRRARQRRVPGRARRRQVPAVARRTSIRTASASGACPTAAC